MKSFFNMPKPRGFKHSPIYFSPEKDALEKRINKVKREIGDLPEEDYKPDLKGAFIDQTSHAKRRSENSEKSSASRNIKLAIALAVLAFVFYYFYIA